MSLIKELKAPVKNNKKKVETHLHLNYNFNLKPVKHSLLRYGDHYLELYFINLL